MNALFITGIDTDAGKTYATGLMGRYLVHTKASVITAKLAQTGCDGISEDILTHRKFMGMPPLDIDTQGLTCEYVFKFSASPHLAAEIENRQIDTNRIVANIHRLQKLYDIVLIEGVGGLLVPITPNCLCADMIHDNAWELVIVTSGKLGSLNHTLLTLESAQNRGIKIRGMIYNSYPSTPAEIDADSKKIFREKLKRIGAEGRFVELPIVSDFSNIPYVDFSPLVAGDGDE